MKLILNESKIVATALDSYEGPMLWMAAPEDFDINKMSEYVLVDGALVYPAADIVRAERTKRLVESDWTQVADAPVDKAAWAAYRQELRDITAQEGFPDDVVWPVAP